jgi:hypothetical protein
LTGFGKGQRTGATCSCQTSSDRERRHAGECIGENSWTASRRTRPVQLTLAEAGRELLRRRAWSQVIGQGAVSARDTDGAIEIVNDSARSVEVPWAGPDVHGGWVTVPAGGRQVIPNRQAQR